MGLLATFGRLLMSWTGSEGWRARREKITGKSKPTYLAYPDTEYQPAIRFYAEGRDVRGRLLREYVDLEGYSLHHLNLARPNARRGETTIGQWFTRKSFEARERLLERLAVVKKEHTQRREFDYPESIKEKT